MTKTATATELSGLKQSDINAHSIQKHPRGAVMSATRITKFECDICGATRLSPKNYDLPAGWTHKRRANKENIHCCKQCRKNENAL